MRWKRAVEEDARERALPAKWWGSQRRGGSGRIGGRGARTMMAWGGEVGKVRVRETCWNMVGARF